MAISNKNLLITDSGTGLKPLDLIEITQKGTKAGEDYKESTKTKGTNSNTSGSTFTASSTSASKQASADAQLATVVDLGNKTNIVDQSTLDAINKPLNLSSAYQEALNYTNSLREQLSSGRTSYTDRINEMMDKIQNREEFSYDVESDMLFQQSLASAMASGKTAMQDTIGQASALTGGYGSTYATSAGNQAYNAYIQDAYENLPEYYQMAMEAYQMEGQEMYNQLGMLKDADATEYGRLYDAWNVNYTTTQDMYNKEYGAWQDSITNAYNSANLQLKEQGQIFDQAYNTYTALQDSANAQYAREYEKWADEVSNALNYAQLAEKQRQYNTSLAQENAQFIAKNDVNGDGVVDKKDQEAKAVSELKPADTKHKEGALEAYNEGGEVAMWRYIESLPSDIEADSIVEYVSNYGKVLAEDDAKRLKGKTFTKKTNTLNGFLGLGKDEERVDKNDVVVDQNGYEYKIKELPEFLQLELTKLKEDESYTVE